MADPEYIEFIKAILRRGRIGDDTIDILLTPENLADLHKARVDFSYDESENNEMFEFLGDVVINCFAAFYIRERFPKIVSEKWLTKIKHYLISKKQLAELAMAEGLEKYILHTVPKPAVLNVEYLSVLEDGMEGLMGCIVVIMERSGYHYGTAMEVTRNIMKSFFDAANVSIEYEVVFDAVSRLKEIYESRKRGYKWPTTTGHNGADKDVCYDVFKKTTSTATIFTVNVYGWPKGNKTVIPENRVLLGTATDTDVKRAKQTAAGKALKILDATYKIYDFPPDPHEV